MRTTLMVLGAVALVASACADDGVDGPAPDPTAATSAVAAACADCRVVAAGNAFQDGDTSVGVTRCDGTSCEVVVAATDGTETELDLVVGDALAAGTGWVVVATGANGLTLRPA